MSHWYNEDGDLVHAWEKGAMPSPSTILDRIKSNSREALIRRLGLEEADELMNTAAERGTRIHKACELWLANGFDAENAETMAGLQVGETVVFLGFTQWWHKYQPELVDSELVVINHKLKYAGRLDLLVKLDGRLWVIDIKTGQDNWRHGLQLKFYEQAVSEAHDLRGTDRPRMGVLALDGKRSAGYRHSKQPYGLMEYKEPLSAILAHIAVFRWWNKKQPAVKPSNVEDVFGD